MYKINIVVIKLTTTEFPPLHAKAKNKLNHSIMNGILFLNKTNSIDLRKTMKTKHISQKPRIMPPHLSHLGLPEYQVSATFPIQMVLHSSPKPSDQPSDTLGFAVSSRAPPPRAGRIPG